MEWLLHSIKPCNSMLFANMLEHLNAQQKFELTAILNQFNKIFNHVLGADLELKPNALPIQRKPFTVPTKYRALFKREINKLVNLQVLNQI